MTHTHTLRRSVTLFAFAAMGLVPLTGCMIKPLQAVNADGTYCFRNGKGALTKLTCTPAPVPAAQVENDAKRFAPDSQALTVYVLRHSLNDATTVLPFQVDGLTGATTIPESLVRLRLKPGSHRLAVQWEGQTHSIEVDGQAGELRAVELVGSGWAWRTRFQWKAAQADATKSRAQTAKLVADLDLRR
jgi:hypothetical protein